MVVRAAAQDDTGLSDNTGQPQEVGMKSDENGNDNENDPSDELEEDKGLPPTPEQLRLKR